MFFKSFILTILATLLLIPCSAYARTTKVVVYGGVALGSTYKETWAALDSKYPRVREVLQRDDTTAKGVRKGIQIFAHKFDKLHHVEVSYWFKNGRLDSCEISSNHSPGSAGEAFFQYLQKRYGEPSQSSPIRIYSGTLRTGGTYTFTEYFWKNPPAKVSLQYLKVPSGISAVATVSR